MNLKLLWEVWGKWEIRVLLLSSMFLQFFLFFTGGLRKCKDNWWLRMPLWLAYLLADYIAIYALGNLSKNQKLCDGPLDGEMQLLVFWAPFLILHLGGQDTITSFAVEDNELWLRHFLSLMSQVALAGYVYWKSRPGVRLMIPAITMFMAGITKYGERTLALRAASMGSLRSSMLTPPDPGPNYAKFVEECQSRTDAGLDAKIVIVLERPPVHDVHIQVKREDYGNLVYRAHRFFQTFRRLFVDLILSFQDRIDSLTFFRELEMDQAFKVVEIELLLMYESLHSKALVIHGWLGRGLRLFTLAAPIVSLVLFTRGDMRGYETVDINISYALLAGAIFLEACAILLIIISHWTYADLRGSEKLQPAARVVLWLIECFQPEKKPRWSNKISQYNLISYSLKDKSHWYKRFMERLEWQWNFRVKTMWDKWRYTKKIDVSVELKDLVFDHLKSKANSCKDPKSYRKVGELRGQWALQRDGLYQKLGWSVECEFDESILLWHIATDLCFHAEHEAEREDEKCCSCSCSCFSKCFPSFCSSKCFPSFRFSKCFPSFRFYKCFQSFCFSKYFPSFRSSKCFPSFRFSKCFPSFHFSKCFPSFCCSGPAADSVRGRHSDPLATKRSREARKISNYMLFLLVMRPFMMTASIGQIRFGDTCAEAKSFFRRYNEIEDEKDCAEKLTDVDTSIAEPRDVKGDRSKSVLFQACKLAKQLKELVDVKEEDRWRLITSVWVEMLCYAAGKCSGFSHARQLSEGGELLTVVWLLMAHFGVGDQYRVESGHARVKLIVGT